MRAHGFRRQRALRLAVFATNLLLALAPALAADDATISLYGKKCSLCHGTDGRGNAKLAEKMKADPAGYDLLDEDSLAKPLEAWIEATAEGQGKMKGFEGRLSAEEIRAVNEYVRSLAPGS